MANRGHSILAAFASRQFFTLWFGLGIPPFLIGTVVVAFRHSIGFGIVTSFVVAVWLLETVFTTCRRCPFYGSAKCGIPSLVTPLILRKASPLSISPGRIRLHLYADLAMILYVNLVYWLSASPVWFAVVLACSFVGWLVVFRRKRFHGLLFRLSANTSHPPAVGGRTELVQLAINRTGRSGFTTATTGVA